MLQIQNTSILYISSVHFGLGCIQNKGDMAATLYFYVS